MKWEPSAFSTDIVTVTWWDMLLLALGRELRDSACLLRRK